MPYSTQCITPLSNFEANMNYKDVSDPSGNLIIIFNIVFIKRGDKFSILYI